MLFTCHLSVYIEEICFVWIYALVAAVQTFTSYQNASNRAKKAIHDNLVARFGLPESDLEAFARDIDGLSDDSGVQIFQVCLNIMCLHNSSLLHLFKNTLTVLSHAESPGRCCCIHANAIGHQQHPPNGIQN